MKKLAVAVKDNGVKVGHFGSCEYFIIYNYDENTNNIEYNNVVFSSKDHDKNIEEWEKSADAIKGSNIVICERIGVVPKAQLKEEGIEIIENSGSVETVLDEFLSNKKN